MLASVPTNRCSEPITSSSGAGSANAGSTSDPAVYYDKLSQEQLEALDG